MNPISVKHWPFTDFLRYEEYMLLQNEMERQQYANIDNPKFNKNVKDEGTSQFATGIKQPAFKTRDSIQLPNLKKKK